MHLCPCSLNNETGDEGDLLINSSDCPESMEDSLQAAGGPAGSGIEDESKQSEEEEEGGLLEKEDASMLQLASGARLLVGFTATPFRLDNRNLGMVFQVCRLRCGGQ